MVPEMELSLSLKIGIYVSKVRRCLQSQNRIFTNDHLYPLMLIYPNYITNNS